MASKNFRGSGAKTRCDSASPESADNINFHDLNKIMLFREWLQNEVKTNGFQKIARAADGRLTSNHVVYVDGQGNLVQGYPGSGKPYVEVSPAFSQLSLQNMHPQGKLFTDLLSGLRKIYGDQVLNWTVHVYNASHPEAGRKGDRTAGYWLKQPQGHYSLVIYPHFYITEHVPIYGMTTSVKLVCCHEC